jgi:hypothetical protein
VWDVSFDALERSRFWQPEKSIDAKCIESSLRPNDRTKVRDFCSGRDSWCVIVWCVIVMSEHGLGPESLEVMNEVRLEGIQGQTCARRQDECDV